MKEALEMIGDPAYWEIVGMPNREIAELELRAKIRDQKIMKDWLTDVGGEA